MRHLNTAKALAHVPPDWAIYFLVPDIDPVFNAMDPQGAAFSLHGKQKADAL